jgi:hypothetical protein
MPVSIGDITEAFEFANTGSNMGEFLAFVCKRTGKIHYQTDFPDAAEMNDELPDDINDEEKYVALPDKRELGLGKPLVLLASSSRTISTTSAISSTSGAPTQNSRPCSPDGVRSTAGTPSKRKPRSRRCENGARCIRSKLSAELARGADEDEHYSFAVALGWERRRSQDGLIRWVWRLTRSPEYK